MRFNKVSLLVLVLGGGMLMAACGGGGDSASTAAVASAPVKTTIGKNDKASSAAILSAVFDTSLTFASGVAAFGTATPTALALTNSGNAEAPAFSVTSAEGAANGAMTFGSCIFTIASSTYATTSALAQGKAVTVTPCSITLDTTGKPANGTASSVNLSMLLGTATSNPVAVVASISPTGAVTVNGKVVATVAVSGATGATGASQ